MTIDPTRARRLFAHPRMAGADDFIAREVARRMLDRLTTVRVDATSVLDLGCGDGADLPVLRQRFEGASIVGLDVAHPRLVRGGALERPHPIRRWLGRHEGPLRVEADFAALPFASRSVDVLWSNLALHWHPQPHLILPEWSRVTRVGGLVAFSVFGPDTLREVAAAFAAVDSDRHVQPFTDMHDYGDMLVASGFTTPVVDMERLTLTYADSASLWRDVRSLGGNALAHRSRTLHGRGFGERLDDALAAGRDASGRRALTFELIFAHAWKGEPRRSSDGDAIVRFERSPR